MVDIARFMTWIGMACGLGVLYAGAAWLGHYYGLVAVPVIFAAVFAVVLVAGSLCCASGREL